MLTKPTAVKTRLLIFSRVGNREEYVQGQPFWDKIMIATRVIPLQLLRPLCPSTQVLLFALDALILQEAFLRTSQQIFSSHAVNYLWMFSSPSLSKLPASRALFQSVVRGEFNPPGISLTVRPHTLNGWPVHGLSLHNHAVTLAAVLSQSTCPGTLNLALPIPG